MTDALLGFGLMAGLCAAAAAVFAGAFRTRKGALAPVLVALAVTGLASGVYLWRGSPELMRSAPMRLALQSPDGAAGEAQPRPDLAAAEAERAALLAREDATADEWGRLADQFRAVGQFPRAAEAFAEAVRLSQGTPREVPYLGALGETLIVQAEGMITPQAEAAFRRIATLRPGDPGADFYLGKAAYQGGYVDEALTRWKALWARTPRDAPWREPLAAELRQAGVDVADLPAPEPPIAGAPGMPAISAEAREAILSMSEEEQIAFIEARVASLAARLEEEGSEDPQEWRRLGFVLEQVGRYDEAADAYGEALKLAPGDEDIAKARARVLIAAEGR